MTANWRARGRASSLLVLLALAFGACAADRLADGRGLLPPPPAGAVATAGAPLAARAFAEAAAPGVSMRTRFEGPGPLDTTVEIRDGVVGPHATAQLAGVDGPTLIDTHSGQGSALLGQRAVPLAPSLPVSVPARSDVAIKNEGDSPLIVRLYVVRGKAP